MLRLVDNIIYKQYYVLTLTFGSDKLASARKLGPRETLIFSRADLSFRVSTKPI